MSYPHFINTFDQTVEVHSKDDIAKLVLLLQYCRGPVRKFIEPCALMSASAGYARARDKHKERFGDEFRVTDAWIQKLKKSKTIGSNDYNSLTFRR